MNRYFTKTEDGKFQHWINDELRATIDQEHLADYKNAGGFHDDPVL